jgi:DNA modification methylase
LPKSTPHVASPATEVQSHEHPRIRPRRRVVTPARASALTNEVELQTEYVTADQVHPADDQFMVHPPAQLAALRASIAENGRLPIITDRHGNIIDGHANFAAQQELGYDRFPIIRLSVDSDQAAHLRIGLNKIQRMSTFELVRFKAYVKKILPITIRRNYAPEMFGMPSVEHDELISGPDEDSESEEINSAEVAASSITRLGDTWTAGDHVIHCGDSLDEASYSAIMGDEKARLCVTDPPFNVPIAGHVSGLGQVQHREFVQASGEMTSEQFSAFLKTILQRQKDVLVDGGLSYNFMDWRSIDLLITEGKCVFDEYKQLIVWNKTSGGMGSFYRSKHELIAVFKNGTAPHVNTFGLGANGRYRTNVFDYAGANVFGKSRDSGLEAHPTVKPTIMIVDIIKDVSHLGDIVLDPFGGSGTTMLAAEKTNRRARLIELDPVYVDTAIRRWEALTGKAAALKATGQTFAEVTALRTAEMRHE